MAGAIKTGRLLAGARSVIVVGNCDDVMWNALQADIEASGDKYDSINDPVDTFTSAALESAVEELEEKGVSALATYPWRQEAGGWLPFQAWAAACGFGAMGVIGVVIHPDYGPWMGLRGAIIMDAELEPDPAEDFDPCGKCDAPCFDACPAGAVSREGCNVRKCIRTRLSEHTCEDRCAAREACVFGKEYRYGRDEITYHSITGIQKIRRMMGH